jgi:LEA14-like dessication related protein
MCVMRGMRGMRKRRPGRAILCGMRSERSCFEMMSVMTGLMTGLVGAGVVAGGLGGCSIVREATNFEPPAMEVVSVRVEPAESAGNGLSVVRFEVLAQNPNKQAVPLEDIAYSVSANGTSVFSGVRNAQRTIPPFGVMRFELPATVASDVASGELTLASVVSYRKPGALADTLYGLDLVKPSKEVKGGVPEYRSTEVPK